MKKRVYILAAAKVAKLFEILAKYDNDKSVNVRCVVNLDIQSKPTTPHFFPFSIVWNKEDISVEHNLDEVDEIHELMTFLRKYAVSIPGAFTELQVEISPG